MSSLTPINTTKAARAAQEKPASLAQTNGFSGLDAKALRGYTRASLTVTGAQPTGVQQLAQRDPLILAEP